MSHENDRPPRPWYRRAGVLVLLGFTFLFGVAFFRIHVRMETTLTGYEIGRLKGEEAALLEKRSLLKMELARLTTKKRLSEASGEETDASKNSSVVAK